MQNDLIVAKGVCLANSSYLRDFFAANQVPVHLESSVESIDEDGVVIINMKTGEQSLVRADSVILSVGYTPAPVVKKQKNIHVIGDAKRVGNLRTVIWSAWDVAMKL